MKEKRRSEITALWITCIPSRQKVGANYHEYLPKYLNWWHFMVVWINFSKPQQYLYIFRRRCKSFKTRNVNVGIYFHYHSLSYSHYESLNFFILLNHHLLNLLCLFTHCGFEDKPMCFCLVPALAALHPARAIISKDLGCSPPGDVEIWNFACWWT